MDKKLFLTTLAQLILEILRLTWLLVESTRKVLACLKITTSHINITIKPLNSMKNTLGVFLAACVKQGNIQNQMETQTLLSLSSSTKELQKESALKEHLN